MNSNIKDGSPDNEAVKIANSLKPFVKKWVEEWDRSCVRRKKMTVTTAPNNGVIGVTDAFSNTELFIPYTPDLSSASVGDVVWCTWMFDNMQTLYAESLYGSGGGGLVPSGGSTGQVLTKTLNGYGWRSLPLYDGSVTIS